MSELSQSNNCKRERLMLYGTKIAPHCCIVVLFCFDAHLQLFGNHVTPMSKTTFYFVIITLVIIDIVQGRYQKNLLAKKEAMEKAAEAKTEKE